MDTVAAMPRKKSRANRSKSNLVRGLTQVNEPDTMIFNARRNPIFASPSASLTTPPPVTRTGKSYRAYNPT